MELKAFADCYQLVSNCSLLRWPEQLPTPSHFSSAHTINDDKPTGASTTTMKTNSSLPDKSLDSGSTAPAFQIHALATEQLSLSPKLHKSRQVPSTYILLTGSWLKSCGTNRKDTSVWRLGLFNPQASFASVCNTE